MTVVRKDGLAGRVACRYQTKDGTAMAGCPEAQAGPEAVAAGAILSAGTGYWRLDSPALEDGTALFDNALAAANAAAGVLVSALLRQRPDWLCLHAAAIRPAGGGKAWLFPGDHKAGKSLFAAVAAARGASVLADDRAVLDLSGAGPAGALIALGIQPKLRLPLPAALPAPLAAFIAGRLGPQEGEMHFLALPAGADGGMLLPFGARAPLARIWFLDRAPDAAAPAVEGLRQAEAAARLIPYIYAPGRDASGRIAAAARLAGAIPVQVLRYRDSWDAVAMLDAPPPAGHRDGEWEGAAR